jgi:regulator of sigma E protease
MITLLSFIIVIGILVFVHEFGHFLVAKKTGVTVEKFSLGFGPKLIGFEKGGTQYMICAIPLGGYVKLKGENPDEPLSNDRGEFASRSVGVRAAIVAAGPFMNFALCFLVMPLVYLIGIQMPAYLEDKPVVQWIGSNSPAERAGIRSGDAILAVNDETVENWKMFNALTQINPGTSVRIRFLRDGRSMATTIQPPAPEEAGAGLGIYHYMPPRVAAVVPDSPASQAGLQPDDVVESVGGRPISHWIELSEAIRDFNGEDLAVGIRRSDRLLLFTLRPELVVEDIVRGSPADAARLKAGDKLLSINGADPARYQQAFRRNDFSAEQRLDLQIIRDRSRLAFSLEAPGAADIGIRVSGKIGIVPAEELSFKRYGLLTSIGEGFKQAWEMTTLTFWALGKLLSFDVSLKTLGGPIMIAKMTGTAAKSGLASLIIFTAFLSINLCILNLLPVPVLDGGHLLFFLIEFIIRRPLGTRQMEIAQKVGLALLIMLLVTVTYNDILRSLPQKYIDLLPWK